MDSQQVSPVLSVMTTPRPRAVSLIKLLARYARKDALDYLQRAELDRNRTSVGAWANTVSSVVTLEQEKGMQRSATAPAWVGHPPRFRAAERLRLVLTNGCNYSCVFCHNEGALPTQLSAATFLSLDMARFFASAGDRAGIKTIKLTGGEPLLWRDGQLRITDLVARLREDVGSGIDVSLTTNGQLLGSLAHPLKDSGLRRVTVSVHTLDPSVFRREISASGSPEHQLRAIEAAATAGLLVKANVVVLPETIPEVPQLCRELFRRGVSVVRLYRALWAPYSPRHPAMRVDDAELVELAFRASGRPRTATATDYLCEFLASRDSHAQFSVQVEGTHGTIELDRMPIDPSRNPSRQEGVYALRIGPEGDLHSRLFSPGVDLKGYYEDGDIDSAAAALVTAGRGLADG